MMVRFSSYIIIFMVSIIVYNSFDYVSGEKGLNAEKANRAEKAKRAKEAKRVEEAKRVNQVADCIGELKEYFGNLCIKKNCPLRCAQQAMVDINYQKFSEGESKGFAKKYFDLLKNNLISNDKMKPHKYCNKKLSILSGKISHLFKKNLDILRNAENLNTQQALLAEIPDNFVDILRNAENLNTQQALLKECYDGLKMFIPEGKVNDIENIVRHTFLDIKANSLKIFDEYSYFLDIITEIKIDKKMPKPIKFCNSKNPLNYGATEH